MKPLLPLAAALLMLSLFVSPGAHAAVSPHAPWDALLKRYVNQQHRVNYEQWKGDGLGTLDAYLAMLAKPFPAEWSVAERHAALTNAYNALTVRWMLQHYPIQSIWKTKKPFTEKRHTVDGKQVSLDDIETGLRETMGERTHAVLVCAARSCPPLRREAYVGDRLEEQLDDNTRAWLANQNLNRFLPNKGVAKVSKIFEWYRKDFDKSGQTLADFLARFAPTGQGEFLRGSAKAKIEFLDYNWGLNDTGQVGSGYGGLSFLWDYARNK